ncbi:MAG: alpha/beta hydrolase [bacterium]
MTNNFEIKLPDAEKIRITAFGSNPNDYKYHAVYVHGFKGFKDWGFVPYMGEYFEKRGVYLITFNFSLNGIGDKLNEFTEMDKFAANTFTREMLELNRLIKDYSEGYFSSNPQKLTLIGHSRGGAIAALCSDNIFVNKTVLWSSIAKLDRYTARQKQIWKKTGYVEVVNTRTNQVMKLNSTLLEDIENNKNSTLSLQKALKNLHKPLLILHGTNDVSVPIEEGEQLYKWSNKEFSGFIKIDKASHTFDIQHPYTGTNDKFEKLLEETHKFIIH